MKIGTSRKKTHFHQQPIGDARQETRAFVFVRRGAHGRARATHNRIPSTGFSQVFCLVSVILERRCMTVELQYVLSPLNLNKHLQHS